MSIAIVTGSAGLIGSEATRFFAAQGMTVIGIDNDMRREFFGEEGSSRRQIQRLQKSLGSSYRHVDGDIRDELLIKNIFAEFCDDIRLVIHAAAQGSNDWAADAPMTDFMVNANGTLNLLEMTRRYSNEAVFIFSSTNKVYGDSPNQLPLIEQATRWEIDPTHPYHSGISEDLSIDQCRHGLSGASKVAADILVQEYGRYYGMKTVTFRSGWLAGPTHSGTHLNGLLNDLVKCAATNTPYAIMGYKGKQVRDHMHCHDLVNAFDQFFKKPNSGEVYNMGGSRFSHCSTLEAIEISERISGQQLEYQVLETNRQGDPIWYVSDVCKFQSHYPNWQLTRNVTDIIHEIYEMNVERWQKPAMR